MGFGHSSCVNLSLSRYLVSSPNTSVFCGAACDGVLPFFFCFFLITDSIHAVVDDDTSKKKISLAYPIYPLTIQWAIFFSAQIHVLLCIQETMKYIFSSGVTAVWNSELKFYLGLELLHTNIQVFFIPGSIDVFEF